MMTFEHNPASSLTNHNERNDHSDYNDHNDHNDRAIRKSDGDERNLIVALCYALVGILGTYQSVMHYEIGTLSHMGPGFFPLLGSALVAFVGVLMLVKERALLTKSLAMLPEINIKSRLDQAGLVVLSSLSLILLGYAVAIYYLGLMLGIVLLVVSTRIFYPESSWRITALTASICCGFTYLLVAVVAPSGIAIWPPFISI